MDHLELRLEGCGLLSVIRCGRERIGACLRELRCSRCGLLRLGCEILRMVELGANVALVPAAVCCDRYQGENNARFDHCEVGLEKIENHYAVPNRLASAARRVVNPLDAMSWPVLGSVT